MNARTALKAQLPLAKQQRTSKNPVYTNTFHSFIHPFAFQSDNETSMAYRYPFHLEMVYPCLCPLRYSPTLRDVPLTKSPANSINVCYNTSMCSYRKEKYGGIVHIGCWWLNRQHGISIYKRVGRPNERVTNLVLYRSDFI